MFVGRVVPPRALFLLRREGVELGQVVDVELRPPEDGTEGPFQIAVGGDADDGEVELDVDVVVVVLALLPGEEALLLVEGPQAVDVLLAGLFGGQKGGLRFEDFPHLEDLPHVSGREVGNAVPSFARRAFEDAFGHEAGQGVAHRRPGELQLGPQSRLEEDVSGQKPFLGHLVKDVPEDHLVGLKGTSVGRRPCQFLYPLSH